MLLGKILKAESGRSTSLSDSVEVIHGRNHGQIPEFNEIKRYLLQWTQVLVKVGGVQVFTIKTEDRKMARRTYIAAPFSLLFLATVAVALERSQANAKPEKSVSVKKTKTESATQVSKPVKTSKIATAQKKSAKKSARRKPAKSSKTRAAKGKRSSVSRKKQIPADKTPWLSPAKEELKSFAIKLAKTLKGSRRSKLLDLMNSATEKRAREDTKNRQSKSGSYYPWTTIQEG